MARRGIAVLILMLPLSACSSSSSPRAATGKTASQRCAAYQKAHYPNANVRVRAVRPKVVCSINIGPVVTCTRSGRGVRESTYFPKEMLEIDVAANGAGRIVRTFRQVCRADETMTTQPLTTTHASPAASSPLAGNWYNHAVGLTIDASGHATISWRTYNWCGPGQDPGPCDKFRGDRIVNGGNAVALFSANGVGRVTWTSAPAQLPVGPVTARLDAKDDVLLLRPSPMGPEQLCGPHAPSRMHCYGGDAPESS